jgi:hypothetical protein
MQGCHGVRDAVIRDRRSNRDGGNSRQGNLERTDVREETSGATGMQQRHEEPKPKRAILPGKQGDVL